ISDCDRNCDIELFRNYKKHLILVKCSKYRPEKKVTVGDIKYLESIVSDYLPDTVGIL
ncbi:30017_t:CDS:1, partial [Racocetra persica]